MPFIILKYLLTAGIIVLVSEVAKTSDKIGALIISLPLMTILTLVWIHLEGGSISKTSNHAYYTFWYVLPTLPMFLVFPFLIERFGFWIALVVSCTLTIILFFPYALFLRQFSIELLP